MGDKELASGTSSAGHVLAPLWLEPLVSQSSQEVIYISAFVLHFNGAVVLVYCCFSTTVAMLGPTLTPMASLSRGESTPHISASGQ